jgi:hypothetical protein
MRQRELMLERAELGLIDDLHRLGRQLAVLRRIYKSYELIVDRILERQRLLRDEARVQAQNQALFQGGTRDRTIIQPRVMERKFTIGEVPNADKPAGVQLSSAAVGRFERLADRIRLYALSEIEECLSEKESLTFLVNPPPSFLCGSFRDLWH